MNCSNFNAGATLSSDPSASVDDTQNTKRSRFLDSYLRTFLLVVLSIYTPYVWVFCTNAGHTLLSWWLVLPGLPALFLGKFGLSMEQCRPISIGLAILLPLTAAIFFRLFPNYRNKIAASAFVYSVNASIFAYLLALA
jgi:hypothetical protein